jgi:ABC-type lipoprotein export system ATPase subunit
LIDSNFAKLLQIAPLGELLTAYPILRDYFENLGIPRLDESKAPADALLCIDDGWFEEFGVTRREIAEQLLAFHDAMTATETLCGVSSLTILGGRNKRGEPEDARIEIRAGTVVSIVGPTGSGKSRLLADIECLAQGDTPTRRRILIDGEPADEEARFRLEGKLVAQLSQNMNFVMDLTVGEFLEMHARSRASGDAGLVTLCFEHANALAGEKFTRDTKVTQLSGGQSRALMITDCAYMSPSPIVLIDEIENAGVDRRAAIALLARAEKIVLISTHDPLLALGAEMRIVIKNGGIFKIFKTSDAERESYARLEKIDSALFDARAKLRAGRRIEHVGVV